MLKLRKRTKIVIGFIILLFIVSSIWFDWFFFNSNSSFFKQELAKAAETSDVIIVFNSGGFGTVQLDYAYDFKPIIDNLKKTIEDLNFKVSIIPYYRTKDGIIGRVGYLKEMFFSFPKESQDLADTLKNFVKEDPGHKIVMAGLSNGAVFVDATMTKIGQADNIIAIELGKPFWANQRVNDQVLSLTNNGKDVLSNGNKPEIIRSLVKAPFKWIYSKIIKKPISYPEAMNMPGHQYYWQDISAETTLFLNKSFVN